MPKAYIYMDGVISSVIDWYAERGITLSRAFPRSVYPAATWNFPPNVYTCPHRDAGNAPCLPCSVTALGDFDPNTGGEMVLFELGVVIKLPAGSTIHLCSGSITHYNLPVGKDESRSSFTQYMAGGLARHVAFGYKSESALSQDHLDYFANTVHERWEDALDLFSSPESINEDRAPFLVST
jgi:hypothetical protein